MFLFSMKTAYDFYTVYILGCVRSVCLLQQIICFIRIDREGFWLGLAHYRSCPVNSGGRVDPRISSQV